MSKLSVITINYNSWAPLGSLLQSLTAQNHVELEVVVVDNASKTSQSKDFFTPLETNGIESKLIKNTENKGFANACNQGAAVATGDYLLFCNPDVEMTKDSLCELFKLYQNNDIQLLTCAQKKLNNKNNTIDGAFPQLARFTPLIGTFFKPQKNKTSSGNAIELTDWISGSVILISKASFKLLQGWDHRFFMYMEDVDLCRRASDLGMKVGVAKNITWIHHHGLSSKPYTADRIRSKTSSIISKHLYVKKHFSHRTKPLAQTFIFTKYFPELLFGSLISILLPTTELKVRRGILLNYFRFLFKKQWF